MQFVNLRHAFPPVLLIVLLSYGEGQSPSAASSNGSAAAVFNQSAEPVGASRCKVCHASEVEGYARSAMAHSLRRAGREPSGAVTTADAKITMYSDASGSWQRLETAGDVTNYRIDYVIGSGNHASGYLVNLGGHLFQSPVAFYKSRNSYDLAPGYEKTKDPDFTRPVAEGCVFCHAGTELHISGTDNQYRSPVFPAEAITCERCHGPSEKHLADPRAGTIVNPAKLEPGARDSICEQCHLMGAARVPNPGREFRDFQPGLRLETTFTTYHDVLPPDTPAREFKVISHVEQLAMSVCARSSQGRLWCGTCHDPHNKPLQPVQYYRSRCLSCHSAPFPQSHPGTQSDCIGCHMPRRDARDGGHTAFTDHRIQRRPQSQSSLAAAGDIAAWREPAPDLQKRNLGIAYLNAGFQRRSSEFIVRGYRLLTEVQNQFAADPEIFTWMGTALLLGKQSSEAQLAFERALMLRPNSAVIETNLAAAHQQEGDVNGTIAHLERAVAIDPLHLSSTSQLIALYRGQGNTIKADELSDRVAALMKEQPDSTAGGWSPSGISSAVPPPKVAEAVFKNIKVLRGVPSSQIIPTMRFIAASLGVQCTFCHVEGHFDDDSKPPKEKARSMMKMMSAINQNNFENTRQVTCYSCHQGAVKPVSVPALAKESAPETSVDLKSKKPWSELPTSDEIIQNFVRALGGTAAIQKINTRAESGTVQSEGKSIRIELLTKGPDKQVSIQHAPSGDRVTGVSGNAGWESAPGHPTRDLSGSELDAVRLDADLQFALHFQQIFPDLRVQYPEMINGHKGYALLAIREGRPPWEFFFDADSGLLLRALRYTETPLGLDPTQIDYQDYRAVDGIQIPYRWTVATARGESTIQLGEVQQNVPIDDAKFFRPSATTQASSKP
ncbi:MAG: c-type cytochrome [Candidatus Sulfotelmatobacter sp.]